MPKLEKRPKASMRLKKQRTERIGRCISPQAEKQSQFSVFSRQTQLSLKALFPRFRQVAVRICHSRQIRREENKSGRSGNQSRHVPSASWWGEKDIYKYMRCLAAEYQSQRPIVKSSACPGPQRQQIVAALETANREFGSQPYINDK